MDNKILKQIKDLRRELRDVNITDIPQLQDISNTTRAVDFWFDNIFADLNVRNKIRGNKEQTIKLMGSINGIIRRLERNRAGIHGEIERLEQDKIDLIIRD
ncbi:MAG TPA: hypothetical protein VFD89_06160 [Clostridia bacterium]|nr:hypothetical protein [Clostridia bacterium]